MSQNQQMSAHWPEEDSGALSIRSSESARSPELDRGLRARQRTGEVPSIDTSVRSARRREFRGLIQTRGKEGWIEAIGRSAECTSGRKGNEWGKGSDGGDLTDCPSCRRSGRHDWIATGGGPHAKAGTVEYRGRICEGNMIHVLDRCRGRKRRASGTTAARRPSAFHAAMAVPPVRVLDLRGCRDLSRRSLSDRAETDDDHGRNQEDAALPVGLVRSEGDHADTLASEEGQDDQRSSNLLIFEPRPTSVKGRAKSECLSAQTNRPGRPSRDRVSTTERESVDRSRDKQIVIPGSDLDFIQSPLARGDSLFYVMASDPTGVRLDCRTGSR
jgi:hypothetical protein